jgi:cobalt/nickel transport system ATP-binding protein
MIRAIEINDLHYKYPDGRVALNGIDLLINEGESVGIIGANGAGKTTLLLHLNGILRGSGQIKIFDIPMITENLKVIRRKVGLVFQDPDDQLFSATVFDDVSFGPFNMNLSKEEVVERTREALSQVGMSGYEARSPHHLSQGEKKRISIATILSMKPEIIVLDEPTSNLDPKNRRNLIKLIKGLNITRIIAGHDLEMILELCSKVILLNNGKIICMGNTSEILRDNKLMEANDLEAIL